MGFKDHFSAGAEGYARYRPRYPRELFEFIAGKCQERNRAWDCATGNGQAAVPLADFFANVDATDASERQIAQAPPHPKIEYRVARAEETPFADASIDLVTVAQAVHWFDFDAFYSEVRRVAKTDGLLAAWTYGVPEIAGVPRELLLAFHRGTVGPYWPPERRYVDENYATVPFPFDEIETPAFGSTVQWTQADFVGFVRTWSSVTRFVEERGEDPVELLLESFEPHWSGAGDTRDVRFPIYLRLGRVD